VPGIISVQATWAQTFNTLVSFNGSNGAGPGAPLVQGTDGNLYGITGAGGAVADGTVFQIMPEGALTTLLSFDGTDGVAPHGLVLATNGNFYGTTGAGGAHGDGTFFEMTPSGTLATLLSFDGTGGPSGLVQATAEDFYGTTNEGGANGAGTVFKITPSGTPTTLYSFCSHLIGGACTDGEFPEGGVVQATNGDFYGTTSLGGANGSNGTVFKITPDGALTTLHSFDITDGARPYGTLIQAADGDFYGTTVFGGNGYGTVFKITPEGKLTTLHKFDSTDGMDTSIGLVQATDGNFYGTAEGGTNSCLCGTIFKITPEGKLTTLHSFDSTDGNGPGGLLQDTDGNFYGPTSQGGANNDGTIFSLSVGLAPFVKTLPTSGKVGAAVRILGTDLKDAASVTFDGAPAVFTVISPSEISTTVPDLATTGTVEVTTPLATLTSNVPFRVRP
jgi:uncharacterized repeat protein (TIGR03803 family)